VFELPGVTGATFFGTALDNLLMLVVLRVSGVPHARPVVLILVGIYVLANTTADLKPDLPLAVEPGPPYEP